MWSKPSAQSAVALALIKAFVFLIFYAYYSILAGKSIAKCKQKLASCTVLYTCIKSQNKPKNNIHVQNSSSKTLIFIIIKMRMIIASKSIILSVKWTCTLFQKFWLFKQ